MKASISRILNIIHGRQADTPQRDLLELIESQPAYWDKCLKKASNGQKILIATSMGCYDHAIIVESLLAVALTIRGANVDILLCDRAIPCCQMTKIFNVSPENLLARSDTPRCDNCVKKGTSAFKPLGIPIHWFNHMIRPEDSLKAEEVSSSIPMDLIPTYRYNGIAVGEHAMAGTLRYYARGDLNGEYHSEKMLRRYLKASLLTALSMQNFLDHHRYDCAVFHHGIYVPQGIIGEVCRDHGVRVVNWNPSYRKHTFIFSHEDSYHHTMITEPTSEWEEFNLDRIREHQILDYLKSRWHGSEDWIWFHEKPYSDLEKIEEETGVDFEKPCIGLLTSVMWDAQLHYASNAFDNMLDWLLATIEYFSLRPELQLIIRIHPAEINGLIPSRQKMFDEIMAHAEKVPENVFIIPPESHISTYAVMERCNAVIIYNTKTGIEISSMGIPVIVAGEAWIRNKGFSIDASSPEEYVKVLDDLPLAHKLSDENLLLAKKYAYHFFYRRMIELPFFVTVKKHKFSIQLSNLRDLKPGNYSGLDVICNGILLGHSFINDN